MDERQYKPLFPWLGGLNTSTDPMILDPNKLVMCDNIIFTTQGSRKKRGGQEHYNASAATSSNFVYLADYWATVSGAQREYFVGITDDGKFWRSAFNGSWSSFSTLTLNVAQGGITHTVKDNDLIIGLQGNTVPVIWDGQNTASNMTLMTSSTSAALPFTKAWIVMSFLERGWFAGDPSNPEKVYISKVGDYADFTATLSPGFATTLNVGIGDGDPSGITALVPSIAGDRVVYAFKRTKIYRIDCSDTDQANWKVTLLTAEIGCVSPSTVAAVDQRDILFASDRGIHTLSQVISATAIIGGDFVSFPIQYDWINVMSGADRSKMSGTYVPSLNSYLLSCKRSGQNAFETIYGYNVELKEWFRWTNVPCNFLMRRFNLSNGVDELYAAAPSGFVNELNKTELNDFGLPIVTQLKTSFWAPDGIPFQENEFMNLGCIYRAHENSTFRVFYSVDGLTTQSVVFEQKVAGGNILGTTKLGPTFLLGNIQAIKPVWQDLMIDEGNSIQFTFQQDGLNEDFELFGIVLEYKPTGIAQNAFRNPLYG